MSTTIAIPMNEETRIALEDCLIDTPNMDARKFVFTNIKQACQDAKRSIRNKVTPVNIRPTDGGPPKQEEFKLKGVNLEEFTLPSDPEWLPKNLDKEDNRPIELKLGDTTMGYIKNYGQIVGVRHAEYNKAEDKFIEHTKAEMLKANAPPDNIKQWEKAQDRIKEDRLKAVPKCIEECLYVSIWPLIQNKIDMSDGQIFDKEYDEQYPDKPEPDKKPAQ